ncbi:MAG: hypothetical protein GC151_03070 [Betaproteobacteria bacterium]|nr:hypothetical protein [Betaproteobacteria bacterium]
MGKKAGKRVDDASMEKKKEKDRDKVARRRPAEQETLMVAVERCPPQSQLVFEWVVGNGLGDEAVPDAQKAYERAFELRLAAVEQKARAPLGDDSCAKGCEARHRSVVGPVFGPQSWQIDAKVSPPRATTWSWVGFVTVTDCAPCA